MNKYDEANLHLAVTRTRLSNSSTLLAHVQAAIALLLSGAGIIKFLDGPVILDFCGWTLLAVSLIVFARGVLLFLNVRRSIVIDSSVPSTLTSAMAERELE